MEFFATCPTGFEQLLSAELRGLGIPQARALRGQVAFQGELEDAYRACLWSRLASRVVLVLDRVDASSADALYEGILGIDWSLHMTRTGTFQIDAHGTNAELRNTQFVALRAKDAIADQLSSTWGVRPSVDTDRPDVSVVVRVGRERAVVGIDLTGDPLFRRGYDSLLSRRSPIPPLRPDYAAALLSQGGWFRQARRDKATLVVAHPGAGSLVVEAAQQFLDRAPGLLRARWGFLGWAGHDADAWERLVAEADHRADQRAGAKLRVLCLESRRASRDVTVQALRSAGMPDVEPVFFSPGEESSNARTAGRGSLLVADLSWVDADDAAQEASALANLSAVASSLGEKAAAIAVLSGSSLVEKVLGSKPSESVDVLVGRDRQRLESFDPQAITGERPVVTLKDGRRIPAFVPGSDQFAARLWKVAKQRAKWGRAEDVSCYRVYDSDLPDYAVSIDLYQGIDGRGRWLQVSEYQAPREVDATLARERLMDVLAIAPAVLGVDPADVFLRVRSHGKGGSQYAEEAREAKPGRDGRARRPGRGQSGPVLPQGAHLVGEGGLTFEVNFERRLDCGIFLDHRDTRALLREMMKDTKGSKRFLNLFAYTGTATCYAADGGAKHTTTVDMSRPSLDWAERNMQRNGFTGPGHEYVQADVLAWVSEQRRTRNRWDLIFCDVPTFSNSSRMRAGSWDVQRDHAELLISLTRLLVRGGTCVFSCNLRSFRPDVDYLERYGVQIEDVTAETIPQDFARNPKIHHCYLVRRTPQAQ